MDGGQQERDLVHVLQGHDFMALRSPGSGTGDWPMPDVMAARCGVIACIELKSGRRPKNVTEAEVRDLDAVAGAFWGATLIGVRYSRDRTFYLVRPDRLDRTPSGAYSIASKPSLLPWSAALPYTVDGSDGVVPLTDDGDLAVRFGQDVRAPTLCDWVDRVTADQRGTIVGDTAGAVRRTERSDDDGDPGVAGDD